MGKWLLSVCFVFATTSAASPLSAVKSAASYAVSQTFSYTKGLAEGIGERIIQRRVKASTIAKTAGVALLCVTIFGCGGRAVVEQEPIAITQTQTNPELLPQQQHQSDWPGRMYVNDMGGIYGADLEKFHETKDSLPAEFYERVFVLHQQNGLNYVHLVRPYSAFYPATEGLEAFDSTLVATSSSGQQLDFVLDTSDVKEILIADHKVYNDSRSALIPFNKVIPLGAKKLPPTGKYPDFYFAADVYMVMSGKHLMIRAFAAGEINTRTFRELQNPMFLLALKEDTLLMQLKKKSNNKPDNRQPYSIAQATE